MSWTAVSLWRSINRWSCGIVVASMSTPRRTVDGAFGCGFAANAAGAAPPATPSNRARLVSRTTERRTGRGITGTSTARVGLHADWGAYDAPRASIPVWPPDTVRATALRGGAHGHR